MDAFDKLASTETAGKQSAYNSLLKKIRHSIYNQNDLAANLTNIVTILHHSMHFTWTGFYYTDQGLLNPGPFQGPAIRRQLSVIEGACGMAFHKECTIIVDDVEQLPGYIPSGAFEKSEIIVPAFKKGEIILLLNVGSDQLRYFDKTDRKNLQQLMHLVEEIL